MNPTPPPRAFRDEKPATRSGFLRVRLAPDEVQAVEKAARAAGLTVAQWVRRMLATATR